jgi:hypothetical protein
MTYTQSTHPNWDFESDQFYFGWLGTYEELRKQSDTLLIQIATGEALPGFTAIPLACIWNDWYLADERTTVNDVTTIRRLTGSKSYKICIPFIEEWERCDFRDSMVIYRIDSGKVQVRTVDRYPFHTDGFSIGIRK